MPVVPKTGEDLTLATGSTTTLEVLDALELTGNELMGDDTGADDAGVEVAEEGGGVLTGATVIDAAEPVVRTLELEELEAVETVDCWLEAVAADPAEVQAAANTNSPSSAAAGAARRAENMKDNHLTDQQAAGPRVGPAYRPWADAPKNTVLDRQGW